MNRKQAHTTSRMQAFTLVELLIYSSLISLLMSVTLYSLYTIHVQNIQLIDTINDAYTL